MFALGDGELGKPSFAPIEKDVCWGGAHLGGERDNEDVAHPSIANVGRNNQHRLRLPASRPGSHAGEMDLSTMRESCCHWLIPRSASLH